MLAVPTAKPAAWRQSGMDALYFMKWKQQQAAT